MSTPKNRHECKLSTEKKVYREIINRVLKSWGESLTEDQISTRVHVMGSRTGADHRFTHTIAPVGPLMCLTAFPEMEDGPTAQSLGLMGLFCALGFPLFAVTLVSPICNYSLSDSPAWITYTVPYIAAFIVYGMRNIILNFWVKKRERS